MAILNVQEFIDWFVEDVEKHKMTERGFEETVEKLKMTAFGDIAQAFVVYKARLKTPAAGGGQIGLDSWTLLRKDGRWWIAACANEIPTADRPLPTELR
jgi:ketosteroid isomerase-like protein